MVTLVADIPSLVRSSRTNAARVTHVCIPGFHSLEFERCVLLRIPKPRIATQEKPFCPALMDIVSLLAMDSELELTTSIPGQMTHIPACETFFLLEKSAQFLTSLIGFHY